MTAEELAAIAGVVISLAFSYVPKLEGWYDDLVTQSKSLVMLGVMVAVSMATFLLSCYGVLEVVVCTQAGAMGLFKVLVAALVANQVTHRLTPRKRY